MKNIQPKNHGSSILWRVLYQVLSNRNCSCKCGALSFRYLAGLHYIVCLRAYTHIHRSGRQQHYPPPQPDQDAAQGRAGAGKGGGGGGSGSGGGAGLMALPCERAFGRAVVVLLCGTARQKASSL